MKLPVLPKDARHARGVALVLVLSCIVLIAMLVVSFLLLVRTDQQASSAFATSAEARLLGDIPINMAIGQIRRGSEQLGYQQSWASQPGMIRTYGLENDGSGYRARATGLYKLYSDDRMVVNTANVTPTSGGLAPADVAGAISQDIADLAVWQDSPGMYTDINEPVPVRVPGSNALNISFPVVDPRALSPGAGALPVEGFGFSEGALPGAFKPGSLTDTNARLPMPVKWLYVLKDGSYTTPSQAAASEATFDGTHAPTAVNPIVGRIAFWTDDDSCKVNVNTASEGTPWYTPLTTNQTDRNFAERLPAHFEYSRAPGHPAQTSLSPVFQVFDSTLAVTPDLSDAELRARLQKYHQFSPRLNWGGTKGGTQLVADPSVSPADKRDRLYANLDEMLLTPGRQLQDTSMTSDRLDLARFFLTTNGRAPEMSLHNKFRFSLWINWAAQADRTSLDNILELVNSSGLRGGGASYNNRGAFDRGLGWSFLRRNNLKMSATGALTGGSSQYSRGDKADHPANMDRLLDVLARATGSTVSGGASNYTRLPGFANASFLEKYGERKRDQILLSMMDVLRSGVDLYRPVRDGKSGYVPQPDTANNTNRLGEFSSVPTDWNSNTRGYGRVPTVSELAIVFMATEADASGKATQMQAFLVLEPFTPFNGPPAWASNVYYKIKGLENLKVTVGSDTIPLFPGRNQLVNKVNFNPGLMAGGNKSPYGGMLTQFARSDTNTYAPKNPASIVPAVRFPFVSDKIPVGGSDTFVFSGGALKVTVASGWEDQATIEADVIPDTIFHQVLNISLAGPAAPPPLNVATSLKTPRIELTDGSSYNTLGKRLALLKDTNGGWRPEVLIRRGDMVRSTQASQLPSSPARGDLRVMAALREVPDTYFSPVGGSAYVSPASEILHDLRCGALSPTEANIPNDVAVSRGRLVYNLNYSPDAQPAVPLGMTAALKKDNRPGDWDNGVGQIEDGPYINRADNGSRWFGADGGYYGRGGGTLGTVAQFDHTFSLYRNAPSAVIFGGIPTGVDITAPAAVEPWQTLLFCPNPPSRRTVALGEPNATDHKGFGAPRDHLLLDLFWMPAVQPYAVSEALSSAGKVNMNYQMMPFTYIERSTGLYAAMKATRVTAISRASATVADHYKGSGVHPYETRYLVNVSETLKGFRHRFETNHDIFRSASEICEIFLVPQRIPGATYASDVPSIPDYAGMTAWWNGTNPSSTSTHPLGLTGDNAREAPYSDLYPRLTTRSNTYTVHYRVQTLTKARSSGVNKWVEGRDVVTGEHRGSATLERYIDPNNYQVASINQGGTAYADSWDGFFRFRIVARKDFTP